MNLSGKILFKLIQCTVKKLWVNFKLIRNRIRMYPALVNCTTIDLFNEWAPEALLEVGERYLSNVHLEGNEQVNFVKIFIFFFTLIYFSQITLK